jgi:hypothetical protein
MGIHPLSVELNQAHALAAEPWCRFHMPSGPCRYASEKSHGDYYNGFLSK